MPIATSRVVRPFLLFLALDCSAARAPVCPQPVASGCALPRGTYHVRYAERAGGTCGERPARDVVAASERVTAFDSPCTGPVTWSRDFCSATFEAACPAEKFGKGFTDRQITHSSYAADGRTRAGTYEYSVFKPDGTPFCKSTYDVHAAVLDCN
jgi:hypothetical protein